MKYTKELARIKATQYAYEMRYGRHTKPKEIPEFSEWFLHGIRKYEEQGADFDLIENGMIRIKWPRKVPMLRSLEDFHREYESMFPTATKVQFEEAAGMA
jgi:hypothetical protein